MAEIEAGAFILKTSVIHSIHTRANSIYTYIHTYAHDARTLPVLSDYSTHETNDEAVKNIFTAQLSTPYLAKPKICIYALNHRITEPEAIVKAPATLVEMDLPLVFSSSKKGGSKSSVTETKSDPSTAIDDVLNSILPPREFVVDDVKYIQYVSKKKSTRSGVNLLQVK